MESSGPTPEHEWLKQLAGKWRYRRGPSLSDVGPWPRQASFHANSPTALFNGMIAPLVPFAIRGAIWYQGESNVGRARQYEELFPLMIRDWRRHFGRGAFLPAAAVTLGEGFKRHVPDWKSLPGRKRPRFREIEMFCASP